MIFNNGGNITVQALCSLTGKFAEVGAEFQRLHSMSATERMNDLYTTIERPNGQLMEHQRKMLNVLFRVLHRTLDVCPHIYQRYIQEKCECLIVKVQ